jgi:signal transduction histidine kinase
MRKAVQILRVLALLLCGVSLVLALTTRTSKANGHADPTVLTTLLPIALTELQSRTLDLLVPILIGAMFLRATDRREIDSPSRWCVALLAIQTVLAFLVADDLQFVVAIEAGLLLPSRVGAVWVFAQAAAVWLVSATHPGLMSWIIPQSSTPRERLLGISAFMLLAMLYNFLAFALGSLAALEGRQRRELAQANGQLQAANRELREAQLAVAEAARVNERLRLARELHDAIGHHLSALSINLQIATHLSKDQARRQVLEAYQLTGILLAEVRDVIAATRAADISDLPSALRAIADRVPSPVIHLELDPAIAAVDGQTGNALFRCAQEVVTNAVRHSGAANLWIEIKPADSGFRLTARDDGQGNPGPAIGNGLRGMMERIRELGGACSFHHPGSGFGIELWLPAEQNPAPRKLIV